MSLVMFLAAGAFVPALAQLPGDPNCDGVVDTSDIEAVVQHNFDDGPPCTINDINGDGRTSAADVVSLVAAVTAPPPEGPVITFLGLAGADGAKLNPIGYAQGIPIYARSSGSGFRLVVEARSGSNRVQPGRTIMNSDPLNPSRRPDLWVISTNPLGDGSPAVCDGGVPAVDPPSFASSQRITNALNDLSCNFAVSTSSSFACTQDSFGAASFLGSGTQVQYCLLVPRSLAFPDSDSLITVLVRDTIGTLGPVQQLLLRVGVGPFATFTATRTPIRVLATATRTPTYTVALPTPTLTRSPSALPTLSPTAAPGSPTRTTTPSRSPTASSPGAASRTPTRTPTPSVIGTATQTATRTPTLAPGPIVSFFGLSRSDDTLVEPTTTTPGGIPVYVRSLGFGFSIVVEGRPGPNGRTVGLDSYVDTLDALPDLQIVASNPLGDGSDAVCDKSGANAGGVPALDPPSFVVNDTDIRIINDFACRFVDGQGQPKGRSGGDACTRVPPNQDFGFVADNSTVQFCAAISRTLEFPPGDTLLTVRFLDENRIDSDPLPGSGTPGNIAQLIIRIGNATPQTATPTSTPSTTQTPTRVPTVTRTPTRPGPTATGSISSPTASPSRTPSPTSGTTPPPGKSPTPTLSRTATRSRTPTPTVTRTPAPFGGPIVTYFGVARFDGTLIDSSGSMPDGTLIYKRPIGAGFIVVVEGRQGSARRPVGAVALSDDSSVLPDLQILSSHDLGNGSPAVCDYIGVGAGGVPGVDPPDFDRPENAPAVNDLACRFRDGSGQPNGRSSNDACILFGSGDFGFANSQSTLQFCAAVDSIIDFPSGDTLLTVRLRDTDGNLGPTARVIVRIGN
ncbi:MAG: hypothetical protein HY270_21750 [Deltaproteobacteria bacterium]|nr:hypothetical protein [Deltaproteobacteria bacterium]